MFEPVNLASTRDRQSLGQILPDADGRSAGALELLASFVELDNSQPLPPDDRAQPALKAVSAGWSWKAPRYSLSGTASFYDNGTTAMRDVPQGTTIVICGRGGCIERVVNDYGPSKAGGRLIDMYRPDFFAICGCGWWSGTTEVTVKVY